jgi:hypothetical protein
MPARFSTHHIPDEGVRFAPGEAVKVIHATGQVRILRDPNGDYEVMGCRPATEFREGPPLLRVDLKRRAAEPQGWPEPPPSPADIGGQIRWRDRR